MSAGGCERTYDRLMDLSLSDVQLSFHRLNTAGDVEAMMARR